MGYAYDTPVETVVVSDVNVPAAINFPHRAILRRLRVVREGGGAFNTTVYSRQFTGTAIALVRISDDGNSNTRLRFSEPHELKAGDVCTVAGSSVGGYNTTHRVTSVEDAYTVVTDKTYTAEASGGTGQLTIPSAEQPLYEVIAQAAATDILRYDGSIPYRNQDVRAATVRHGKLYLKLSAADTYYVTTASESELD